MKMTKILTEWRKFVIKEAIDKSNFEKIIEDAWAKKGRPYNEELSYVKAALHAARYMNGSGTNKDQEYLRRIEFGKTATERIQELNRNASLFADYFDAMETYTPAKDKRFKDTKDKTFKGIGIVPTWAKSNLSPSQYTGVFANGNTVEEAYQELFARDRCLFLSVKYPISRPGQLRLSLCLYLSAFDFGLWRKALDLGRWPARGLGH